MTTSPFRDPPSLADIEQAAARIAPYAERTPVLRSAVLDEQLDCNLWFKCENLQRAGAFKFRGACNAVFSLSDAAARRGVLTQSSGNHGAAVALACRLRGIPATVVVPRSAPRMKRDAIAYWGARIVDCDTHQAARDAATEAELESTGASLVLPFNDARVIAGQATATAELLQDQPQLDTVIAPISGGGLLSGAALAAHAHNPDIRIIGAEPSGARDAFDSLASGQRITGRIAHTICDGLRAELGPMTFDLLRSHRAEILLVDDSETVHAMRKVFEQLKLVIEASAAITLATLFKYRDRFRGKKVGVILSGGNLDLDRLPWQDPT
ncbi:threonine ammonia-lyase [Pseudomarimonas arenosa]|uniref:Pyridoxal-phosphate dependent enzyme n=1 Tax=Pseudomarimonas arenosa TaxID=2774145 RepID=A0AAW3ZLL5_9GAMM|nr:pyridoxal-phosphate dependent enzyme [Pseudomarimonas arenosa]MBD8526059.1 pyridoxal-phosphate dependent enzyme [Pseudomarimonas arenosa]